MNSVSWFHTSQRNVSAEMKVVRSLEFHAFAKCKLEANQKRRGRIITFTDRSHFRVSLFSLVSVGSHQSAT
jgi:hypothetical protein